MKIDELIANAILILDNTGIVKEDEETGEKYILRSFRGQISSFGAAVSMGSLLSAVAFFSKKGGSDTDRPLLMQAIYRLITGQEESNDNSLLMHVKDNNTAETKRSVIDAAVALKLAMNAYELRDKEDKKDNKEEDANANV